MVTLMRLLALRSRVHQLRLRPCFSVAISIIRLADLYLIGLSSALSHLGVYNLVSLTSCYIQYTWNVGRICCMFRV